ncbi:hypothetical protein E2K93_09960 [Thalassotalea sp. HSM 43]|uniref:hypothetical protein n=1 Tax=Thalassotalea sp. HSM 43 TaxID=2552945 RepID=UPI0010814B65|nr:hypothetical protein [Thalassotalea sp. HSM 43]QBY04695.1 hypothetical protein E2K93_09960 [Thalassotalea sp. HSM 43]
MTKQTKAKTCNHCGKRSRKVKYNSCDECRIDGFVSSPNFQWLWWQAERGGYNQLPETFEELVAVLEVKRRANRYSGFKLVNGELTSDYNYEVGHRYPCSKGGALIAENLIVLPWAVNRALGDKHGYGLEHLAKPTKPFKDIKEFRRVFLKRFKSNLVELKKYSINQQLDDFDVSGWNAEMMLAEEMEKLNIKTVKGTEYLVSDKHRIESKFAELCGGLETIERVKDYATQEYNIMEHYKQQEQLMEQHEIREAMATIESGNYEMEEVIATEKEKKTEREQVVEILKRFPDDFKPSTDNEHASNSHTFTRKYYRLIKQKYPDYFYKWVAQAQGALGLSTPNWSNRLVIGHLT